MGYDVFKYNGVYLTTEDLYDWYRKIKDTTIQTTKTW
jgi:hypothetical protein